MEYKGCRYMHSCVRTLGAEGLRVVNISMISNEISYISHLYLYTRDLRECLVIDSSDVDRRPQMCISTPMHVNVNLQVDIYLQQISSFQSPHLYHDNVTVTE